MQTHIIERTCSTNDVLNYCLSLQDKKTQEIAQLKLKHVKSRSRRHEKLDNMKNFGRGRSCVSECRERLNTIREDDIED